jgi:hypothetical protein
MRQRAALIVIAIAGLASAATSASTPPPPDVVGVATGELLLTPDQPLVSVELVVHGNAAIGANSSTSFSLSPESIVAVDGGEPSGPSDPKASSVLFQVVPRDAAAGAQPPAWSNPLFGSWPVDCASGGPCDARFTFRAFLTDPSDGAQRVTWKATVENRTTAAVAVEPGAALTIDADPPAVAADAMASATATFDRITVSRDHPRSVHTVRFSAPFGPPDGDLAAGSLLRVTATASDGEPPPVRMFFRTPPDRAYEMSNYRTTVHNPFYACVGGATPCEGELQVIFEWSGGPVEREAIIEADLSAWLPRPEGVPADAVLDLSVVASEPDQSGAVMRASLSGVFEIDRDVSADGAIVDVVLDQQAVPQGRPTEGVARATLRTRVVGITPETGDPTVDDIDVRLGIDDAFPASFGAMPFIVGENETIGSPLLEVACQGRSQCPFAFAIGIGKRPDVKRTIRVEWVLDVELTLPDGAEFDPAAKIVLEVRPDP